jgi:protein TonB
LGEQGKVLLRVHVDEQGMPTSVVVRTSSGFERLDNVALETVRRWKFVPAKRGNDPVSAFVIVPIVFNLRS